MLFAQEKKPKYDRKEEVLFDGKRYKKYNNYVTMGGGYLISNIRDDAQKNIGFDFQFHIRRQQFQTGLNMSGPEFLSNNNIQFHSGYGLRFEKNRSNLSVYGGLTYFYGVLTVSDTAGIIPIYYQGVGAYFSAQAITKFTYDIGGGLELFGEYSKKQKIIGLKFILFFSGAYRGAKKNFNPNVRSENNK